MIGDYGACRVGDALKAAKALAELFLDSELAILLKSNEKILRHLFLVQFTFR